MLHGRYLASLQISSLPNSVQKTANAPSDGQSLASPRSSHDTTLTALAQLGALRLDTARALVSLIDSKRQYILAEATRTLSLQSDSRHGAADALWFGATVIPRSHGICEVVLKGASDFSETADRSGSGIITITGLDENPDFKDRAYVKSGPKLKFYAGAPIVDLGGEVIGIYCIFDDKPRSPLSHIEKQFLKDMAKSVKDHLDGLQAQAKFKRRAKLVSGLESFVGGLSALPLLSYSTEAREEIEERQWANETQEKKDGREEVGGEGEREGGKRDSISVLGRGEEPRHDRGLPKAPTTGPISTDNASIVEPLPEETPASLVDASTRLDEALSKGSRPMFARAANIIRQCGDYDCVAFFYMTASITSNGFHHSPDVLSASDSRNSGSLDALNLDSPEEHAPDLDYFREGRSQHARPPGHEPTVEGPCEVLGSSFKDIKCKADIDSLGHFPRFSRRDLQSVLGKHPRAKTISFFPSGDVIGDTSSSGSGMEQPGPLEDLGQDIDASHKTQPQHTKPKKSRLLSLRKLSPDAQSFVILPLWDFERHRWFTCCICWSAAARTGVDLEGDLQYLRVFGNSIMMALCHLDAAFTNRAKQSFVASISHELRSPLHGILGALELLYDTDLSRFQHEMVDSISSCGRTLLDTLEHVMDIARINSFSRQKRETNLANGRSGEDKSTQTHVVQARASIFDLSGLIEEVVEAVWIGHVGQGLPHQFEDLSSFTDGSDHPGHISTTSTFSRGRIRIALQLPYRQDWLVNMQAGALRRIVMNIFGNALKYTTEGLITLVLRVDAVQMHELQFSVLVEDTGCGISDDYQRNFLFKPFFQESNLSPGSGLGLSIVKQITDDLRGHIRLSSSKGKGTQVQVTLTTPAISNKKVITSVPQKPMSEETIRQGLAGLRIRILTSATASDVSQRGEIATNAECQQARSLEQLGADWYGVDIAVLPSWYPGAADIVVLLEPDFRSLKQIEAESAGSKRHSVLLVASDSVEMSALRSDDRISGTRLVIEVLAQP